MFWVDETIEEILKRQDKEYTVTDYKTPSGKIHVGSLRGVMIHNVIYQGLLEKGKKTAFIYGFDDMDPMDGFPEYLPKEFKKYMGMPLCNIPSPQSGYKSFAQYFAQDFENVYRKLGVKSKTIWASELYKSGQYDQAIKIILDNAKEIRQIYKNISGSQKPDNWYAFNVICPECGKIGTTRIYDWDGKVVSFICEPKMVKWAEGCGYEGKISPFKGNGKMPYKVETPSKWFIFGTNVELAGKDHYTKGGTFDVAKEIARKIFKINPAYGYGYEWLLIGGKSMSSSMGVGVSAQEMSQILPAELLRFLLVRTKANRQLEFDPEGDAIPKLFDEYDRCANAFLKDPESDLAQAYLYSKLSEVRPPQYRMRFIKIAYLLQMVRKNVLQYAEEEKSRKLSKDEIIELKVRENYAKIWLSKYAPENYKFEIQKEIPEAAKNLSADQKTFLSKIANLLEQKKWVGEELHSEIHNLKKEMNLDAKLAFSAIYLSLLGKDSGPQAGWLIVSLDKDFVINRFRQV